MGTREEEGWRSSLSHIYLGLSARYSLWGAEVKHRVGAAKALALGRG